MKRPAKHLESSRKQKAKRLSARPEHVPFAQTARLPTCLGKLLLARSLSYSRASLSPDGVRG